MLPTPSVSGYYFWRQEAQYFGVGKIERDQVEDYARRKELDVTAIERWLAPNLNYDRWYANVERFDRRWQGSCLRWRDGHHAVQPRGVRQRAATTS